VCIYISPANTKNVINHDYTFNIVCGRIPCVNLEAPRERSYRQKRERRESTRSTALLESSYAEGQRRTARWKREREGEQERTESTTLLAQTTVARQKGEREREQKTGLVIELLFFWHRFSYRAPIHK
jgi:hypothetical protein